MSLSVITKMEINVNKMQKKEKAWEKIGENTTSQGKWAVSYVINRHGGGIEAIVKYDGCVEIFIFFNGALPGKQNNDPDYIDSIHICDLDKFIQQLQELKDLSEQHFSVSSI